MTQIYIADVHTHSSLGKNEAIFNHFICLDKYYSDGTLNIVGDATDDGYKSQLDMLERLVYGRFVGFNLIPGNHDINVFGLIKNDVSLLDFDLTSFNLIKLISTEIEKIDEDPSHDVIRIMINSAVHGSARGNKSILDYSVSLVKKFLEAGAKFFSLEFHHDIFDTTEVTGTDASFFISELSKIVEGKAKVSIITGHTHSPMTQNIGQDIKVYVIGSFVYGYYLVRKFGSLDITRFKCQSCYDIEQFDLAMK